MPLNTTRKPRRSRPWHRSNRKGTAAVELAIVAPVIIVLVMGTIEFGRAMVVLQVITNASRVAARSAVMPSGSSSTAIAAAEEYAEAAGVSGLTIQVTPSPSSANVGDAITSEVTVSYADNTWMPGDWFLGGVTLSASSVMAKEGYQ